MKGVEQFRTESEPARTVQHEASGDDGRPAGGRQTECTRVSGTLTRRAVCWPASRLAGAATGGVRSPGEPSCGSSPAAPRDSGGQNGRTDARCERT